MTPEEYALQGRVLGHDSVQEALEKARKEHPGLEAREFCQRYHSLLKALQNHNSEYQKGFIQDEIDRSEDWMGQRQVPHLPTDTQHLSDLSRQFVNKHAEKELLNKGTYGNPGEDDIKQVINFPHEEGVDVFNDTGKHLYLHHGWRSDEFEKHKDDMSREIAHHLEHNPLMGQEGYQAGDDT